MTALNLVVLRVADTERAARFYSALGPEFARHRHGKGAEHCACEMSGAMIDAGKIKPTISKTFPLVQVATAWQEAASQHIPGKIALTVA